MKGIERLSTKNGFPGAYTQMWLSIKSCKVLLDENIQVISEEQKQRLDKQINHMSPRKA